MKIYNKLVRDKIPQIIKDNGEEPKLHTLNNREFFEELINKLHEETTEFEEAKNLDELADIIEVIYALAEVLGYQISDLEAARITKAHKRGGFKQKIFLESVK